MTGDETYTYVRGVNLIFGRARYYLYNAHGDVVQLTNTNGQLTKNYNYDAFGNERNPDEDDVNPFRYCGEYYDTETGLYYLRARYYDPLIGRFTQEDTYRGNHKDPLSLNFYVYCYNDPVNLFDPDGHMPIHQLNKYSFLYNRNLMSRQQASAAALTENLYNIYVGFHEIAQLNLAKHLYNLGYSPYLEYKITGVDRADIVAANMVWEVKPITQNGLKQLQKYIDGGGLLPGHAFLPIKDIPILGDIKMGILSSIIAPGVAYYFFYFRDKQGKLCTVPSPEVKKAVQKATAATIAVGLIMALTIIEDFATAGAGIVDDAASLAAAQELADYILSMP